MDNTLSINRSIVVLLILNALLGFVYSNLPNTYIEKPQYHQLLLMMTLIAAIIVFVVWFYGWQHERREKAKYQLDATEVAIWETSLKWLLPIFFTAMFAVIGSRALVFYWGASASSQTVPAKIIAISAQQDWWQVQLSAPISQTVTLAAAPMVLKGLTVGEIISLEYRETPYSYNFTDLIDYFGIIR